MTHVRSNEAATPWDHVSEQCEKWFDEHSKPLEVQGIPSPIGYRRWV